MANELKRSKPIFIEKKYEEQINEETLKLYKRYKRDMQMRELSDKTIYNYERDLMQWFAYLAKEQFNPVITDVTEDDIEEFIFYCKEEGNNTERIKRRMSSISAFYNFLKRYLKRKGQKIENPCEYIVRPKKGLPVVVQTFLTEDQVKTIREKLKEHGDLQLTTFFEFGICTMARVNALSNIRWEQIDLENYTVDDVLEKEGKIVTLYFDDRVKNLLVELKEKRKEDEIESDYLFTAKYRGKYDKVGTSTLGAWARKIGKFIGLDTLHCHDLRHSGSQLRKIAGMPIEEISSLLSHSGLDVTKKHYLRDDKKRKGEMVRKFSI